MSNHFNYIKRTSSIEDREKAILDNINADQNAVTHLKYMNSERDLSLPLDKQSKALDKYLDSQEDG